MALRNEIAEMRKQMAENESKVGSQLKLFISANDVRFSLKTQKAELQEAQDLIIQEQVKIQKILQDLT